MEARRLSTKPVAVWLLIGVLMIIVQIVLGGITRLTDSGLSITEWKPILGAVPPATDAEWQKAFDQYRQIAQYKHLHSFFTLEDFKSIYFWEWLHRLWGRLIGIVFIIPFFIFLFTKRFNRDMVKPFIILFLLGALQGLIGWIMVQSGLNDEKLYVSHIRLAIHFMLALTLLVYTFWFALKLLVDDSKVISYPAAKNFLLFIIILLAIQLIYGAFMAGLKAATYAPTWPLINGDLIPPNMSKFEGKSDSFFSAWINNPVSVHFIHRNLAYIISILILIWSFRLRINQKNSFVFWMKWFPMVIVLLQVALGVASVLTSPQKKLQDWGIFETSALLHQFVAMFLLLSLVFSFYLLRRKENLISSSAVDAHLI